MIKDQNRLTIRQTHYELGLFLALIISGILFPPHTFSTFNSPQIYWIAILLMIIFFSVLYLTYGVKRETIFDKTNNKLSITKDLLFYKQTSQISLSEIKEVVLQKSVSRRGGIGGSASRRIWVLGNNIRLEVWFQHTRAIYYYSHKDIVEQLAFSIADFLKVPLDAHRQVL